jgi:large subunit ribosomal protein L18
MSRQRIHTKIRKTIKGSAVRPRLSVYRSLSNLFAQLIDDSTGKTLVAANSLKTKGPLMAKAENVGLEIAKKAKEAKIKKAVYDRGGFAYKGAVKALAEAARKAGLEI